MLLSVEHEMPVIATSQEERRGHAASPEVFETLWSELAANGWQRDGAHAVSRVPMLTPAGARKPLLTMTTDTGPTLEIAPCPAETIVEVEEQTNHIRAEAGRKLAMHGFGLLGSGVHPLAGATKREYYRLRTPRMAYDYAIRERGWRHWRLVNIAAMQEVIDVPTRQAPRVFAAMNRLAGIMLFLFRNDPDYNRAPDKGAVYSVRPGAWRAQMPATGPFASDREKVGMPRAEVQTWRQYLDLLWRTRMFLLGTKTGDLVYVPDHPTFERFLQEAPEYGWQARRIDSPEPQRVTPSMVHVAQTDWTYMGFARLRLFWRDDTDLQELLGARCEDASLDRFLDHHLEKVLIENRSAASPLPGEEMCSLALVTGIIENFDVAEAYLRSKPYSFWKEVACAAETQALASRVRDESVLGISEHIIGIAADGLRRRGRNEERYLDPVAKRVQSSFESCSERNLRIRQRDGDEALLQSLLYGFHS